MHIRSPSADIYLIFTPSSPGPQGLSLNISKGDTYLILACVGISFDLI
jgi:hypothetical protein